MPFAADSASIPLSLSLPGSRGLVFAHASLAVHLEQLLSSLLRLQIDRERAAWARLAFCLLPECVGLDGSQPENALPVRVSSVRACRTTTGVLSRQVQWYRSCWAHSRFHRLLYQINVHWSGQFNIPGGWLGTSWSSFCHWDGRRENCFQGVKKERNGRSGVHTTDAAIATWQMPLAVYLALGVGTTLGQLKWNGGWFTGWAESRTRRKSRTFCCKRKKRNAEWSLHTFLGFLNTILINSNLSLKFQGWFRGIKGTNGDRPQKRCK